MINIRTYTSQDAQALMEIFFHTIHIVNANDYTKEQLDVWAPESSLNIERWAKKFAQTKPLVAVSGDTVVGFAEFEDNGHIDCFYCHHEWIGKGVGTTLMNAIFKKAKAKNIRRIFVEASITAKPFFENKGFTTQEEQQVEKGGIKLTNYKMEKLINP